MDVANPVYGSGHHHGAGDMCGFLIAYLRPSEETINQRMEPDKEVNGCGGGSGELHKQQVNSRTG